MHTMQFGYFKLSLRVHACANCKHHLSYSGHAAYSGDDAEQADDSESDQPVAAAANSSNSMPQKRAVYKSDALLFSKILCLSLLTEELEAIRKPVLLVLFFCRLYRSFIELEVSVAYSC